MEFAINYVNNDFNAKYTFDEDIYLKYPGFRPNTYEFKNMPKLKNKILLHGIIPSSGSIFDEHLCDNMDYWIEVFKKNENRWASFHFYYEDKFCTLDRVDKVCKSNIEKIRKALPGVPIIIENVPHGYNDMNWFLYPDKIKEYLEKFDLGLLLDISHMCISCKNLGIDIDEYISKIPLNRIIEVHVSGYYMENLKYYDAHFECFEEIYNLYYDILGKAKNIKMTSLEYPVYNNIPVVIDYLEKNDYDKIYNIQKKQLKKFREIYNNHLYKK